MINNENNRIDTRVRLYLYHGDDKILQNIREVSKVAMMYSSFPMEEND